MGSARYTADDWTAYSSKHITGKSVDAVYASRTINAALDPKDVKIRESCDSDVNPNSTAIIVGLDVSGSMDSVLDVIAQKGLNTLITEIYARNPVPDPHVMVMGIGDVEAGDSAPLQVSQFEADIRIAEQLTNIYFEKRGGGNNYESYALAWYFAAMHTRIDCFEKRQKKGFIFTIGDEEPTPYLRASDLSRILGYTPQKDYTADELLTMAQRQYEVFHCIIEEGNHCRGGGLKKVQDKWRKLLGQHVLSVSDHTKIAEVIVSALQVVSGEDSDTVSSTWEGDTALVVQKATKGLAKLNKNDLVKV